MYLMNHVFDLLTKTYKIGSKKICRIGTLKS